MCLIFIRTFDSKFTLGLVPTCSLGWFKSLFLNNFEVFAFWCFQSVPTTFPKGSLEVRVVFSKILNGFPKFQRVFLNLFPRAIIRTNIWNNQSTMVFTYMGPIWASIQYKGTTQRSSQHISIKIILMIPLEMSLHIKD